MHKLESPILIVIEDTEKNVSLPSALNNTNNENKYNNN